MAKVKVKVNSKLLTKQLRTAIRQRAKKTFPALLEKAIITDNILKGKSPVKGAGRFVKYSRSYVNQIRTYLNAFSKKATPVNMKLSGQMLSTFSVTFSRNVITVGFSDKLARIHNQGKGKNPERRLLPTGAGENFNTSISKTIRVELESIIRKILRTR